MTPASTATRLPAAIARAAVVTQAPSPAPAARQGGRHRAAETQGPVTFATLQQLARRGKHSEGQRGRAIAEPRPDEADPLAWLGFAASRP
jgi:hypothetical protein